MLRGAGDARRGTTPRTRPATRSTRVLPFVAMVHNKAKPLVHPSTSPPPVPPPAWRSLPLGEAEAQMQHGLQSVRSAFGGLNSAFVSVSLPADKAIFILLTVCICACAYTRTCRKRLAARAKAREAEAYTRLGDEEAGRRVSPSKRSAAKASTPPPRFASESGGRTNLDLLLQLLPPPAVPACKNPSDEDEARDEEEVGVVLEERDGELAEDVVGEDGRHGEDGT